MDKDATAPEGGTREESEETKKENEETHET